MKSVTTATFLLLGLSSWGLLLACNQQPSSAETSAPGDKAAPSGTPAAQSEADADVLALVNGVPLRAPDIDYLVASQKRGASKRKLDEDALKKLLEETIDKELARQEAEKKGLATDAEYLRKLRFMEAPVNDFKRSELSRQLNEREKKQLDKPTVADAREYFSKNKATFTTKVHVKQMMVRDNAAKILKWKKQLDSGKSFDEVAAQNFPKNLPATARSPWDLGFLSLSQVPEAWRTALKKMKEGEVSPVLSGQLGRQWVIQLIERKEDKGITFESVQADLMKLLESKKLSELEASARSSRRQAAKVVYVRPPQMPEAAPKY